MNSQRFVFAINASMACNTQNPDIRCRKELEFKQTTLHLRTNVHSDARDTTTTMYQLKAISHTELPSIPKGFVNVLSKYGKSR